MILKALYADKLYHHLSWVFNLHIVGFFSSFIITWANSYNKSLSIDIYILFLWSTLIHKLCFLQEIYFKCNDIVRLKVKEWKRYIMQMSKKTILISDILKFIPNKITKEHLASLVAQMVKNLPAKHETWVWFLGWEDTLEKEMATHSSILSWRIPWTNKPGGLQSMGSQRVNHDKWLSLFKKHYLMKKGSVHQNNVIILNV